jgi:hypothetical protein
MPLTLGLSSGAGNLKNKAEAISLGYRVNYVSNPTFETNTTGWVSVSGATLERVTDEYYTGSASLKVTNTTANPAAQFGGTNTLIPFLFEGVYQISAYVKVGLGNAPANYFLRYLEYEFASGGSTIATGNVGVTQLSYTGDWVRISGSFTKNIIGNYLSVRVVGSLANPNEFFHVDSIMVENSSTLKPYFDGSSNGFWTGSENASFSGGSPYQT